MASEPRRVGNYVYCDEGTWPLPNDDLEWKLRYADDMSRRDRLVAASILAAYSELVACDQHKRRRVVRVLREMEASDG